jgi:hypothetical protein
MYFKPEMFHPLFQILSADTIARDMERTVTEVNMLLQVILSYGPLKSAKLLRSNSSLMRSKPNLS